MRKSIQEVEKDRRVSILKEKRQAEMENARPLEKGRYCPVYKIVEEMSVRCGNCHYNRYDEGDPAKQVCLMTDKTKARERGIPNLSKKKVPMSQWKPKKDNDEPKFIEL